MEADPGSGQGTDGEGRGIQKSFQTERKCGASKQSDCLGQAWMGQWAGSLAQPRLLLVCSLNRRPRHACSSLVSDTHWMWVCHAWERCAGPWAPRALQNWPATSHLLSRAFHSCRSSTRTRHTCVVTQEVFILCQKKRRFTVLQSVCFETSLVRLRCRL